MNVDGDLFSSRSDTPLHLLSLMMDSRWVSTTYIKETFTEESSNKEKSTYKICEHPGCSPCKQRSLPHPSIGFPPRWTNMRWKVITPLLRVPWDGERGRRLLDTNHNFHQRGRTWAPLACLVSGPFLRHHAALTYLTIGHSRITAHSSRPPSAHPAYQHPEHSPSPAPSSHSSRFAQPHAHEYRQGIAPQPMRHAFTHPGGWPDRPQRLRARGSVGSASRARTSRSSSFLVSTPSQERLGKRKRPASAERSTALPQAVVTHRDSGGPQRSHRRHHNVAEKTHSTMLPSGGMYMTFPLDIPSPEPDAEGSAPAGPPPFEHGPSELPPRRYETQGAEGESSGPERPAKRGRLPADVMDHVSATPQVSCCHIF
jgi:hypothetical protein